MTQTMAPAPSLVAKLLPQIQQVEQDTKEAIMQLDEIANWDASENNHEALLLSIDQVRTQIQEWKQTMSSYLRSLWFEETREYNKYRREVERTLHIRHCAELETLFPSLRTTAKELNTYQKFSTSLSKKQQQPTEGVDESGAEMEEVDEMDPEDSEEHALYRDHLFALGFLYDESSNRLRSLCQRQAREANVLSQVSTRHAGKLLEVKANDENKLEQLLRQTVSHLEALIAAVEKKISLSHQVASYTIYRHGHHQHSSNAKGTAKNMSAHQGNNSDVNVEAPSSAGLLVPQPPSSVPNPKQQQVGELQQQSRPGAAKSSEKRTAHPSSDEVDGEEDEDF